MTIMINKYFNRFSPVWPGCRTGAFLGSGSAGNVWELIDEEHPGAAREAVKEVLIPPEDAGGLEEAKLQGLDFAGAKIYFAQMKQRALDEVELMQKLAACPNIVHISGCEVRELDEAAGEVGWVIFIRMERLQPLKSKLISEGITPDEIRHLGMDICRALEACGEQRIAHRDVKPENIFYDPENRRFKLGDFGISCYLARATEEKGLPGTLTHMSPQIFRGESFTPADDLYALGIVLYKLLNDNRVPFLPAYPIPFSPQERDQALADRLRGAVLPPPSTLASEPGSIHPTLKLDADAMQMLRQLAGVVLRAVDPEPAKRYASAKAFREALESI